MMQKYNIIYADPPWHYNNTGLRGAAKKKYEQLTDDALKSLPISDLAAKDAALFLWVTHPKLPVGIEVLHSWGFSFKTIAFVWVKYNARANSLFTGTGFYTRSNCEVCLLGVRGKLPRRSKSVHSVVLARWEKHSKKPRAIRKRIELLYGDVPRIELFATECAKGWDVTGYEVDGMDIRNFVVQ